MNIKGSPKGWTTKQTIATLAQVRGSEVAKQLCGKDFIAWADEVLAAVRGG